VRLAAEAGVAIAIHELAGFVDWNLVLAGGVGSAALEHGDIDVGCLTDPGRGSRS